MHTALFIPNSFRWDNTESIAGEYRINYDNGTTLSLPVTSGGNIRNFKSPGFLKLPYERPAMVSDNLTLLSACCWKNTHPDDLEPEPHWYYTHGLSYVGPSLAQAYTATGDEKYAKRLFEYFIDFISKCPVDDADAIGDNEYSLPAADVDGDGWPDRPGQCQPWEASTSSTRLGIWIKCIVQCMDSKHLTIKFKEKKIKMRIKFINIWGNYVSRIIPGELFYPQPKGKITDNLYIVQDKEVNLFIYSDGKNTICIDSGFRNNDYIIEKDEDSDFGVTLPDLESF